MSIFSNVLSSIRYYFFGLYERLDKHHTFLMSGGLAFSIFACIVPLTLVILAILSNIFSKPEAISEIYSQIDRIIPYPDLAAPVKEFFSDRIDRMSSVAEVAGIIGFVGLFITATGLFSSLRTILNSVFKITKIESVLLGKLWDVVLVLIVLIVMIVLMMAIPALETGLELTDNLTWLNQFSVTFIDKAFLNLITFISLFVVFYAIYWLVPVRKPSWRTIVVSAVVSALLWILAKELFGYYINHSATIKHIYGMYSFVIISAMWIYYSAMVLIIGALSGQLYFERHKKKKSLQT